MSTSSMEAVSDSHPVASPPPTPSPHSNPPFATGEVDIDELASSVEDPPLGQLTLFKSVFGVGVSLARYVVDDPLWPLLAAAGLPCSSCRGSATLLVIAPATCHLHVDFWKYTAIPDNALDPPSSQSNGGPSPIRLSRDRLEEDRLELQDFVHRQPKFPAVEEPIPSGPHRSLAPDKVPSIPKKRKRTVRIGEASSSKRKRSVEQDPGLGNTSDYRPVVLVLPPQATSRSEVVEPHTPSRGDALNQASPPLPSLGVPSSFPPRADTSYGGRTTQSGSFGQFIPPTLTATVPRDRLKSPPFLQRNRETLRPYPRSQINTSLKTENDNLKSEVTELRRLLEVSRAENVMLTSLLRETSSLLDDRSKELESSCQALREVSVDRVEYQRVLMQFRAIEAELPDLSSEDILTRFFLAQSEVGSYRELAVNQKQEIARLRQQIADVDKHSFETHEELDAANARAMRLRDRLEELEESVHRYRSRAHVAEGLIRQYPEDEGLYEVDLPSLSSMQDRLNESEALVRRLATFAHRLYTADPANLLHYHNMYVGGLLEAVILLLSRSLAHPPEEMRTVVELALDYLSQGRFTHGELHLCSISSLLYYYSNAADRVDGLYQEVFSHSRFSSDEAFLTAAQHAGYVDACPGSLEPPLHRRLFSFGHPIPLPQSPGTSPVLGATIPPPTETPLFLLESLSPPSLIPSSASLPNVPREIVDLTMEDDDELYESREQFLVRMGETSEIKQEPSDPNVV
ncbi:hypothetical protein F5876DRAFT_82413 [Lentinula aff. lateritia]|uniref:Uncharacterized protein n=1 Tax=Lentinula aff. lateritia TaxID=2804960 RepID=A0ACC1TJS4_9AGAR|nr:hypothetical protein F5876DRAFT_82413 [Lentinula aff. lateritia]